jgi:hypothetical protein
MATDTSDRPVAQPAVDALLDFAEITRPDINRADLHGAILATHEAGWPWKRTGKAVMQILMDGETPRDLRTAATAAEPWRARRTRR